ncbi:MAG: hypothetical protein ACI85O_003592 [Saprospiraceae bacterium]|jgi:hypothetical protein
MTLANFLLTTFQTIVKKSKNHIFVTHFSLEKVINERYNANLPTFAQRNGYLSVSAKSSFDKFYGEGEINSKTTDRKCRIYFLFDISR